MGRQYIVGAGDPVAGSATDAVQARAPCAGTVRAGIRGGLTGAVLIRVYEALVSVGAQHPMPLALVVKRSFAPQPYGRA